MPQRKAFLLTLILYFGIALVAFASVLLFEGRETEKQESITVKLTQIETPNCNCQQPKTHTKAIKTTQNQLSVSAPSSLPIEKPQESKPSPQAVDTPKQTPQPLMTPAITKSEKQPLLQQAIPVAKPKKEEIDPSAEFVQANFAKIHEAISRLKTYPSSAVKLGMQGSTLVSFRLMPSGEVTDIKIVNSSGHTILDKNSIRIVQEAASSFPKPSTPATIVVPIEYQLR